MGNKVLLYTKYAETLYHKANQLIPPRNVIVF